MSGELRPTTRRRGWLPLLLGAGLVLLAGLGAVAAWRAHRVTPDQPGPARSAEPPDPRRTYAGPYRNINPDVQYVGDAACAPCHQGIARSYARHPMGRSLVPVTDLLDRQRYTPDTNNPFTALGRRFQVDRKGEYLWHRQTLLDDQAQPPAELAQEVRWAVGSGAKGYSYLVERDGYLLQTAISWYTQKRRWDLSPGFGPSALAGRVVTAGCLFCHTNRLRLDPDHPDRFLAPVFEGHAIGCERCHGPGARHATGDLDHTIVNPARLEPPLRDAVCEQCHLEGEARLVRAGRGLFDYRPGLPLADFWAVLVEARPGGEGARAVNHVEQMEQSRCFRASAGRLGCISCHDPHVRVGPGERVAHYRARCLQCHDVGKDEGGRMKDEPEKRASDSSSILPPSSFRRPGCAVPVARRRQTSPQDSCIDCHMPRYANSDVAHAASTDHRIVRRPTSPPGPPADPDAARFVNFYDDRFPGGDPEAERTQGLGLVKLMTAGLLTPQRHGEQALLLLDSAVARHPHDAELRASKTEALLLLGRHSEAVAEARLALAERPGDWRLLAEAADAAQAEGQTDLALDYWRRAVEINPCVPDYQASLVGLLVRTGRRDEARQRCDRLLQLDPLNAAGRQWLRQLR